MPKDRQSIVVDRRSIALGLSIAAAFLIVASLGGQLIKYVGGHDTVYGLVTLFNVDEEGNAPAWFSSSMLLVSAFLLALIGKLARSSASPDARYWTLLATVFLFMAVDEAAELHEMLARPTREILGFQPSGLLFFSWVIPGMAIAAAVGLYFIRFLLRLPPETRRLFITAAALYLGGALGIELIGSNYHHIHGGENLTYSLIATVEEAMEMAGVIVFIHAMLRYIEENHGELRIRLTSLQKAGVPDAKQPDRDSVGTDALRRLATPAPERAGIPMQAALSGPLAEKLVVLKHTQEGPAANGEQSLH